VRGNQKNNQCRFFGICSLFFLLCSCSPQRYFFAEVRPKGYFSTPSTPNKDRVQLNACVPPHRQSEVVPLLVAISNRSNTAWTVDADQISVASGAGDKQWLPIPPEEAAQMSPMPWRDALAAILDRAGTFGSYVAAIGGGGGALHALVENQNISDEAAIGVGAGAGAGILLGTLFEWLRLSSSYEIKEASEANQKMVFLALKDKSILYTHYSALGYVYFSSDVFPRDVKDVGRVMFRLVRGDPSKDWVSPPNYKFPPSPKDSATCKQERKKCGQERKPAADCDKEEKECKEKPTYRYEGFDLSPVVCECTLPLLACSESSTQNVLSKTPEPCTSAENRPDDSSCSKIEANGMDIPVTPTGWILPKNPSRFPFLPSVPRPDR
jgi:hypothetical protein